jgi:type 1 glutamine amidotransferase
MKMASPSGLRSKTDIEPPSETHQANLIPQPAMRNYYLLPALLLILISLIGIAPLGADEKKPHVVLVCGTLHYSPELTMPVFAKELEKFGFRTTVVIGEGNPEKKTEDVLPGIEVLAEADLVIFFMRFLKLPDDEWQPIEDYLKSGKPVIGLRTANHSFKYPKDHPRFEWNDGFGRRAMGTPYVVHQSSATDIKVVAENANHPIMTHVSKQEWVSPGTLYLAQLEKGCTILVNGSGTGKERLLKKSFGEIQVKEFETAPVAWAWENEWGGKSFYTSFGHPGDFAEESFNRMVVNAVHWGLELPVPAADVKISTWKIERGDKKH